MTDVLINGPDNDQGMTFIFAHGAGAGMDHEFMEDMASRLSTLGIRVLRFNFPYMEKRKIDGKRRPPDRAPKLLDAFNAVLDQYADGNVVIGGKSMGGRMASHLTERQDVAAVACLGFPLHPPGKPEKDKGEHLSSINKPLLILQGERDTFGNRQELTDYPLSPSVFLHFLPDGDHSFKPRKASGFSDSDNRQQAAEKLAEFIKKAML
ncbi:alpha/beta fold hydrolase [Veronia pacifica]|uniref:Alpha/beta hydrolase n=1 Tax=Veronia pacifica TaxID=1080227 RepID=A0A1C3EI66_9GAMM|nr:alpha/beta fold hydrolase [Veronia pacifica]ODA32917.1 alpha/beta hydrolase [Veronia pacifica]